MKIIADLHTHTIKSQSCCSTILENVHEARNKNISLVAITDYGPNNSGNTVELLNYLSNIPAEINKIKILKGIETRVIDLRNGATDIDKEIEYDFDWVIGTYLGISDYDKKILTNPLLTNLYLQMSENPLINTISHLEHFDCGFNIDRVIQRMKEKGKVVEISEAILKNSKNPEEVERLTVIIKECLKYSVPVCVVSNSHCATEVGHFDVTADYLNAINFPEELVINSNEELLFDYIGNFKKLRMAALWREQKNTLFPIKH